jgi:hypothetical protein
MQLEAVKIEANLENCGKEPAEVSPYGYEVQCHAKSKLGTL